MKSRTRRTFLQLAVGSGILSTAGCVGQANQRTPISDTTQTPDETEIVNEPTSTPTPDPIEDILISLRNATSTEETIYLLLAQGVETVLDEEVTVGPDDGFFIDTGIDEQGSYEITATIEDGREGSYPFSVDDYALGIKFARDHL